MNLDINPIDDYTIEVYSANTDKLVGKILHQEFDNLWYFLYSDCGCVWSSDVLYELAEILDNLNK